MKQTIIVIDDSAVVLEQVKSCLSDKYKVLPYTSGSKALEFIANRDVDLIMLDILMVEVDGFEIFRQIRKNPRYADIPIVFLTAQNNEALMLRAFEMGAADYITKPFLPNILSRKIGLHMELVAKNRELMSYTEGLESLINTKTQFITRIQDSLITSISALIEYRNGQFGGHITRTKEYMRVLSNACLESGRFNEELTLDLVSEIVSATPLHDLGKLAVPDYILNNPGKLSDEDFELMKNHTLIGANTLGAAAEEMGAESFLDIASNLSLYHHERYDGSGYPSGVKGCAIPLSGRLMAVVDVYDALTSERPYKPAISHEDAVAIINDDVSEQFDPNIIYAFNTVIDSFAGISKYKPKKNPPYIL